MYSIIILREGVEVGRLEELYSEAGVALHLVALKAMISLFALHRSEIQKNVHLEFTFRKFCQNVFDKNSRLSWEGEVAGWLQH